MMGLAVAVTVVCRRSKDASVRGIGVVLVGRGVASSDGRRGARLGSDGMRERSSRGCRSRDNGEVDDGWRGGIVAQGLDARRELQNAGSLFFCAQPSDDGAVVG